MKPGDIGTRAETAVVKYLRENGWPHVERRRLRGRDDCGDITGTPALCWEVKGGKQTRAYSDLALTEWLAEAETERVNARADVGVLVLQRHGVGAANAGRWWAYLSGADLALLLIGSRVTRPGPPAWRAHLRDVVTLLRASGYGDPL